MCRYVIHTVGPRYNIKYKTAAESALFSSYRSVMKIVRFVSLLVFVIFWETAIVHVHVTVRSGQVYPHPPPLPSPRMLLMRLIIRKLNLSVVVDFRFISAFLYVHWAMNSHVRQLLNFYQLSSLEFDANVLEAILTFKDFQFWPDTEKFSSNTQCSLCMKECPFEFDTSYRNDYRINFSNGHFINRILGVRLTCLDWKTF